MKIYIVLFILIFIPIIGCSIDEDQGIKEALNNDAAGGSAADAYADRIPPQEALLLITRQTIVDLQV